MRSLVFVFCCFLASLGSAQSNGETGVLIQPADLGEIEKLLDLSSSSPIGICYQDYRNAFLLLMLGDKVYLENTIDGSLIPIYLYNLSLRINKKQLLFPRHCEDY